VEELTRQRREGTEHERADSVEYSAAGHPLVEQLVAEQGTGPVTDASVFHGDFRPEEGPVEEFLKTLREWRGLSLVRSPGLIFPIRLKPLDGEAKANRGGPRHGRLRSVWVASATARRLRRITRKRTTGLPSGRTAAASRGGIPACAQP